VASLLGNPAHPLARLGNHLEALRVAYPTFDFSAPILGLRGRRFVVERRNGLADGLHTLITADLIELEAALILDAIETKRSARSRSARIRDTPCPS
jgi:hypothetical protein